jgi:hypothetical protein
MQPPRAAALLTFLPSVNACYTSFYTRLQKKVDEKANFFWKKAQFGTVFVGTVKNLYK